MGLIWMVLSRSWTSEASHLLSMISGLKNISGPMKISWPHSTWISWEMSPVVYLAGHNRGSLEFDHLSLLLDPGVEDFELGDRVFGDIAVFVFDFLGNIHDVFGGDLLASLDQGVFDVLGDVLSCERNVFDATSDDVAVDLGQGWVPTIGMMCVTPSPESTTVPVRPMLFCTGFSELYHALYRARVAWTPM